MAFSREHNGVCTGTTGDCLIRLELTGAVLEHVGARTTAQIVRTRTTGDRVVAHATNQRVARTATDQRVGVVRTRGLDRHARTRTLQVQTCRGRIGLNLNTARKRSIRLSTQGHRLHTSAGQVQNLDLLDIGKVRTGQRQGSGTTVHANHIRFRPTNDRRITRQRSLIRIDKYVAPRTTHQAVRTRTTGDRVVAHSTN